MIPAGSQVRLLRLALAVSGALFVVQLLRRAPVLGLLLGLLLLVGLRLARRRGATPAATPGCARRHGAGWPSALLGLAGAAACGLVAAAVFWTRLGAPSDGSDLGLRGLQSVFLAVTLATVAFPTTWGLAVMGLWAREALVVKPQERRVTRGMKVAASFVLLVQALSVVASRLFAPLYPQ